MSIRRVHHWVRSTLRQLPLAILRRRRRKSFLPEIELLEDRTQPAVFLGPTTWTVLNTNDSGAWSLRQAILDAHDGDTIQFGSEVRGQIALLSTLDINKDVQILGPGADQLRITRGTNSSISLLNIDDDATVTIRGLEFTGGKRTGGFGGAIRNDGHLTLEQVLVDHNTAEYGGGIYNQGYLSILNSTISDNFADRRDEVGGDGGGIYNAGGATLIVSGVTFDDNIADDDGGGLYNAGWFSESYGRFTISASTFSNNDADDFGGGIANFGFGSLTNVTLAGNSAGEGNGILHGGAIFQVTSGTQDGQTVTLTIVNVTVSDNRHGGISNAGNNAIVIENTIVAQNDHNEDVSGRFTSLGDNLIGNRNGATGFSSAAGDLVGTFQQPVNARLGSLADNGGPTKTMALDASSPAVDAGANLSGVTTDQRGELRDAHTDIGAYERVHTNHAPQATVTLSSATPLTNDVLTAVATKFDADGDAVTLRYVWKVNGQVRQITTTTATSDTFDLRVAGNGNVNDIITVEVTPSDPSTNGTTVQAQATVRNSVPVAVDGTATVGYRATGIDIPLSATDADGTVLSYHVNQPAHGYVSVLGNVAHYVPDGTFAGEDTFTFYVSDGVASSSPATVRVNVTNAAPTVSVALSPESPNTNSILTATATAHDPEGDALTYHYVWRVNGFIKQETTSSSATDTFDLSREGYGRSYQTISVEVTVSDRFQATASDNDSVVVQNSAPVASDGTASDVHNAGVVVITLSASDADGDNLTYTKVTDPAHGTVVIEGSVAYYYPDGDFSGEDRFTWQVSDGHTTSSIATTKITLTNIAPTATVAFDNASPYTNDVLVARATANDADGDDVTLTFVWRVNGEIRQTTTLTVGAGAVVSSFASFAAIVVPQAGESDSFDLGAEGHGNRGDTITVEVIPSDGFGDGETVSADAIVQNSAPVSVASDASVRHNDASGVSIPLLATDLDNDNLTYRLVTWPEFGCVRIVGNTARYIPSGDYVGQDSFTWQAFDGDLAGEITTVLIDVTNVAPTATVQLDSASPGTSDILTATATGHDADGDPVSFRYIWSVNGTPVEDVHGNTLDLSVAGHGNPGDTITVEAIPNDGFTDGESAAAHATVRVSAVSQLTISSGGAFGDEGPYTRDLLTAHLATNSEATQFTFVWKVNGVVQQTTTTALHTDQFDLGKPGHGNHGDVVTVEVMIDGEPVSAEVVVETLPETELSIAGATSVIVGQDYTLKLDAAVQAAVDSWTIHWGDGDTQTVDGSAKSVTHRYKDAPNGYRITVSATEDDGSRTRSAGFRTVNVLLTTISAATSTQIAAGAGTVPLGLTHGAGEISAQVSRGDSDHDITVFLAVYNDPTPQTSEDNLTNDDATGNVVLSGAGTSVLSYDLRVSGADENDGVVLVLFFKVPAGTPHPSLRMFDAETGQYVTPTGSTTHFFANGKSFYLDDEGFHIIIDETSTPKAHTLNGTVFTITGSPDVSAVVSVTTATANGPSTKTTTSADPLAGLLSSAAPGISASGQSGAVAPTVSSSANISDGAEVEAGAMEEMFKKIMEEAIRVLKKIREVAPMKDLAPMSRANPPQAPREDALVESAAAENAAAESAGLYFQDASVDACWESPAARETFASDARILEPQNSRLDTNWAGALLGASFCLSLSTDAFASRRKKKFVIRES